MTPNNCCGSEKKAFRFFAMPMVFFNDLRYAKLTLAAIILYTILRSRVSLSCKNGKLDKQGRPVVFCTIEQAMQLLRCGNQKVIKTMAELEEYGLIKRKRRGMGKANLIYVYDVEEPVDNSVDNHVDNLLTGDKGCENHISRDVDCTLQDMRNPHPNKSLRNEKQNTTNQIDNRSGSIKAASWQQYYDYFTESLDFEGLLDVIPNDYEVLEEIHRILADICSSKDTEIQVNRHPMDIEVVRSRFLHLGPSHIRYVVDSLHKPHKKVHDPRQYLITMLYNAAATKSVSYILDANATKGCDS